MSAWKSLYHILRLTLAVLFIWAGARKLMDPAAFEVVIADFGLLPAFLLPSAAIALPLLEVIAGAALLFDSAYEKKPAYFAARDALAA